MGCFSFLDCVNGYPVRYGEQACILVPKEKRKFMKKFAPFYFEKYECGEDGILNIWTNAYDLYGHFDGVDVYEFLAFVNLYNAPAAEKERIIGLLPPVPPMEEFCGLANYEKEAMQNDGKSLEQIANIDAELREMRYRNALMRRQDLENDIRGYKWKKDDSRDLGIELFHQIGTNLKYPLKITHCDDVCYEDVRGYSESDPDQGL